MSVKVTLLLLGYCGRARGISCGRERAPLRVRALPRAEFDTWVADAQKRFAQADGSAPVIAAAPASQASLQIAEARR